MTKQKVGLTLFWIAVVWSVCWGVIGSISMNPAIKYLTMDELNQTMWTPTGPWFLTWGVLGVPLGALVAFIGMLLYSGAKGTTVRTYGLGGFLAYVFSMVIGLVGHHPALFGIGGTLILLFFFGILWLWAKERMVLKDASPAAADLRLIGYVFFLLGSWFTCGIAGQPFLKAFEAVPPNTPLHIIVLFVLAGLFFFLSHYKARRQ